jgi:hypothetical protein
MNKLWGYNPDEDGETTERHNRRLLRATGYGPWPLRSGADSSGRAR